MPKVNWYVSTQGGDNITAKVLSMSIYWGRTKYLDDYAGGRLQLTINNASNYAAGLAYGTYLRVTNDKNFSMVYWVQQVEYSDYPGNTGLNTATITCVDGLGLIGRSQLTAITLSTTTTVLQGGEVLTAIAYPGSYGSTVGQSTASGTVYTGTALNRFNLLNATERGRLCVNDSTIAFFGRNQTVATDTGYTIGRTASSTQLAYQEFRRIQNGVQFINTATISPDGLASQTSTNTTSVTTYGRAFYSSSTVDSTTTQASGNADWVVNTFADPNSLRFELTFTDVMNETGALTSFFNQFGAFTVVRPVLVYYQLPGAAQTSQTMILEGININVTPQMTTCDVSYSPLTYYQFFTLDSATLGILDTSRLGW